MMGFFFFFFKLPVSSSNPGGSGPDPSGQRGQPALEDPRTGERTEPSPSLPTRHPQPKGVRRAHGAGALQRTLQRGAEAAQISLRRSETVWKWLLKKKKTFGSKSRRQLFVVFCVQD